MGLHTGLVGVTGVLLIKVLLIKLNGSGPHAGGAAHIIEVST